MTKLILETIEGVAIRHDGVVYSLLRPSRHHHVVWIMSEIGMGPETMRDQGFITSTAGQILVKTGPDDTLFSEDVW